MSTESEPLPLKDLINFLFEHVQHPEGRPYITQEVADQVRISHATINQLRTGRNKNPTVPTLQEIARFFGVPLSFFQCSTEDECYAILAGQRPEDLPGPIAEIAFRASGLSAKSQEDILKIITWVEAAERERKAGRATPDFPDDLDEEP
jgi:transcriptional regulator with XRE-family HTH domain